ncbi:DegT/DnrJ/EryC1/StrS family aminotransferase [Streptomyces fulvoviolaceus]|uniref:DegT/DnrJ/EryC1/StrS family aminotransferase n=1 Tax=Streptomyces fulvoviolaceus TaxID=285535 RepID=UPI0021C0DDC0|nr:aminotransferase class I/II-fold pyridoxal phosphate-dependent enzyme [Streptomyces fulvoviolaceus]MCT9076396.1 DegT/DnrJ/EryC1/StrS family aminotransferase [Streptomyces fulvoviolaceus]
MGSLAISGGDPAIARPYRTFAHPRIDDGEFRRLADPELRDQVVSFDGLGLVSRVEDTFRDVLGLGGYTMATNSGTSALYALYYAAGLGEGDEVLVPAYTFFATAMPLFRLGCRPVLVDSTDNGNIDPADIRRKITPATKAIVITHMWGIPCDMDEILAVAAEFGLPVLEDASHAHGATYRGTVAGAFGNGAAWSLGAKKIVTGGQGGILHSPDGEFLERAFLVSRANDKQHDRGITSAHLQPYAVTGSGFNLRIHPFSAFVVEGQLRSLSRQLTERRESAAFLARELGRLPGLSVPRVPDGAEPAWYAFPLQYAPEELGGLPREDFVRAVVAEGAVEADIPGSTCPLTRFRAFTGEDGTYPAAPVSRIIHDEADFPGAHRFHTGIVKLPVWYGEQRLAYARAYVDAITKVVENVKDLL